MRFDIETYKRHAGRLDDHDIDYDVFRDRPLGPDTLRTLRYMHDVEQHTVCYLAQLLTGRSRHDRDIATFLTFWAFEEHWHGEAVARVLRAHGIEPDALGATGTPTRPGMVGRLSAGVARMAAQSTDASIAVHMTWGAVNEWCTQAGYRQLASRAAHPVLHVLLDRIARQEGRHIDFYASQAERRLDASALARRMTRHALERLWAPVGSGIMPRVEVAHVVQHLFGGVDGAATCDRIDRRIQRLPGLEGLCIVRREMRRHPAPLGRTVDVAVV